MLHITIGRSLGDRKNLEQEAQKLQQLLDANSIKYSLKTLKTTNDVVEHIRDMKNHPMYLSLEFLMEREVKSIPISDLVSFEYCQKQVIIQTLRTNYRCKNTLRNVFSLVGNHGFACPHKSFIVNLRHITKIKGYDITMNDGSIIPLSQKKSKQFRDVYKNYLDSIYNSRSL